MNQLTFVFAYHSQRPESSKSSEASNKLNIPLWIFVDYLNQNHGQHREYDDYEIQDIPRILDISLITPVETMHDHLDYTLDNKDPRNDRQHAFNCALLIFVRQTWFIQSQQQTIQCNHVIDKSSEIWIWDECS